MDSPQSVVSPFKNHSIFPEAEKQNLDLFTRNPSYSSREIEAFLGVLEVFIHQARDIHNICIYQKQDVYAKLCLTSDPDNSVSTQIINGGGKNPVFNENVRLDVHTADSSLKCEIWMLSRVRNYMEDQLLGFALVPLSDVLMKNGKLEKEFSLSSTDLFHSPAGFVQLSLSYSGASPEVIVIPSLPTSKSTDEPESDTSELGKIEFPDPKIANENDRMVTEYFGISSESLVSSVTETQLSSDIFATAADSFSTGKNNSRVDNLKHNSPPSSVSTNGSSDTPRASKSPDQEFISVLKENKTEKPAEAGDAESEVSGDANGPTFTKPVVTINIEPEQKVVQQDFVDLYMKSMQQFTESLAKMKLPMDMVSEPTSSGNSSSDSKLQTPTPKSTGSRVFYGSRAFF